MKNLSKILTLIILVLGLSYSAKSQTTTKKTDLIMLQDKSEINGIITEISEDEIKYKKATNPDGPVYSIKKSGVYMIIYSNGEREKIESSATPAVSTTVPPPPTAKPSSKSQVADKKPKSPSQPAEVAVKSTPIPVETNSNGNESSVSGGFLDLGTNLNSLGKEGAPITIIVNGYSKVWNDLYLGVNNTLILSDSEFFGTKSSSFVNSTALGIRYYFNGLLSLDATKFQIYGGATLLDFTSVSTTVGSNTTSGSEFSFLFTGRVGARYGFTKAVGVFTELGFGKGDTAINAGLSFRFGK